ncbi:MAG: NFACT RNA binding domain-containing protein, partial [Candidatus Eisenbacteria bacterium]
PRLARTHSIVRALRKHRSRMARKIDAIRGDLAEAERAPEYRRQAEALLAYLHEVPKRASHVKLADPHDPERTLDITLDPALNPQGNAARYFKRAAKGERGAVEIRSRLQATEGELAALTDLIDRAKALEDANLDDAALDPAERAGIERDLELTAKKLPLALRTELLPAPAPGSARSGAHANHPRAPGSLSPGTARSSADAATQTTADVPEKLHVPNPPKPKRPELPAKLQPRRLRTTDDGWYVLIGRTNEGNDHLTLHMARPEDYWFHVHGASGSHVVLRRGKGKNEPSKRTLEEVAAWAAFYSQARTAGKVSVIWTLKKYVRKPRGAKPGTVHCEREKSIMARPREPEKSNLADQADQESES